MGCGASKAVDVQEAPIDAKMVSSPNNKAAQVAAQKPSPSRSTSSHTADSGIGDEEIAERASETVRSTRDTSATSSRSAPCVLERPSSRGGRAFDITFDEPAAGRAPARLQALSSSSRKKKGDLTIEELQRKLEAAEVRRKMYEAKLKDKLKRELSKKEKANSAIEESIRSNSISVQKNMQEKEDRAREQREQHLKQLRDKLKAKEEHARRVREAKAANASAEGDHDEDDM